MNLLKYFFFILSSFLFLVNADAQVHKTIDQLALEVEPAMIELRRHFHQFPELSNREFKTAERIAEELRKLGLPVDTGIAHTGVVAVLEGGKPGPTIGLRADIDGLPVTERAPIPFASKERSEFNGEEVGVMHACGHDTHIAMLLGAAKVLTQIKDDIQGKIVFVFQPAEEGAPQGEEGGAELMVKEGIIDRYGIEVFFGQHISSGVPAGTINYRPGGTMAAVDRLEIKVKGKQTHGSRPWQGVDPIVTASHIVVGLQTIVSRQIDVTNAAAVVTIGKIDGGVRSNIIPEEVNMVGTIRTLDSKMQDKIHERIKRTAEKIAESQGAIAEVKITRGYPVTFNNIELTRDMIQSIFNAAGEDKVQVVPARTGAEDFSFFAKEVPGLFYFVGGRPHDVSPDEAFPHHTPDFFIDESGLILGMRTLCYLAVDYAAKNAN